MTPPQATHETHTAASRLRFESAALPAVRAWLAAVPLDFIRLLLAGGTGGAGSASGSAFGPAIAAPGEAPGAAPEAALDEWRCKLAYAAFEALGSLRSEELFDCIVDYPDSAPALGDLRECLSNTSLAGAVTASFRQALQRRLLHPGAATGDILSQYVSTIRALRELDPLGGILQGVSDPIKEYVKGRRDAIRCIVTMLTEDSGGGQSLLEELATESAHADAAETDAEGVRISAHT